jgi:transcriptional regulator with XRE-family HTH domain
VAVLAEPNGRSLTEHQEDAPRHVVAWALNPGMPAAAQLGVFLKSLRRRIDRSADYLGYYKRLPCRRGRLVSQEEIAEAVEVSRGWYNMLESGARLRASTQLVARIAETLMLSEEERTELFRLAVPEVSLPSAAAKAEDRTSFSLAKLRTLARRITHVSSFDEAVTAAVETVLAALSPSCMAMASLVSDDAPPRLIAFGPRAGLADPTVAEACLAANFPNRFGRTTFNQNRPAYQGAVDGSFTYEQRTTDGSSFLIAVSDTRTSVPGAVPDVVNYTTLSAVAYWDWNSKLESRSALTHGLFTNGIYRGNLCCLWTDPRAMTAAEIEIIQTASAIVELAASGGTPLQI